MFMASVWKGGNNASLARPSFVPSPHTVQLEMRRYLQPCPAVRSGMSTCGMPIMIACLEDPIYARRSPHRGGNFTANVILFKGDDSAKLLEHAHGTPAFANQGEMCRRWSPRHPDRGFRVRPMALFATEQRDSAPRRRVMEDATTEVTHHEHDV